MHPTVGLFENGEIDRGILEHLLLEEPFQGSQMHLLQLEAVKEGNLNSDHPLNRILTKWLAALWMKDWQNGPCLIEIRGFTIHGSYLLG
jgi:hypothetical protein